MKKSDALFVAAISALFTVQAAKSQTIADWTFESSGLGSSSPTYAPGAGIASTNFYAEAGPDAGTAAAWGLHATAATYSSPAGDGSVKSLSANNWSVGDYYEFSIPLDLLDNTYTGIQVSYQQNGSSTGPATFNLQYSINGTAFTTMGSDYTLTSGVTWSASTPNLATLESYNFSGVTALDTASTIYFRIVDDGATAINGGNIGTAGTGRIDNFVVSANITAVPEPSVAALAALGGVATLFALRRKH